MHPRAVLHRMGDQADFEQIDRLKLTPADIAGEAAGAETETEASHCTAFERGGGTAIGVVDAGDDAQPALVLGYLLDPADPLIGAVLPVERQRLLSVSQSCGEGTGAEVWQWRP